MSELRDPAHGSWTVFEGERPRAHLGEVGIFLREDVNRPIEWPITLKVLRINENRHMQSISVEVDEKFNVTVGKLDELDLKEPS